MGASIYAIVPPPTEKRHFYTTRHYVFSKEIWRGRRGNNRRHTAVVFHNKAGFALFVVCVGRMLEQQLRSDRSIFPVVLLPFGAESHGGVCVTRMYSQN